MKEYVLSLKDWQQLAKKYVLDLDKEITSIVNFLDFINPNYIVLNKEYVAAGFNFLSDAQLSTLGIIHRIPVVGDNDKIYIELDKMWKHSIIINNFGQGRVFVRWQGEEVDTLDEGFALIARGSTVDYKPYYSIVSLDSSGSYYTLKSIASDGEKLTYNWLYYENATDDFGTKYLFTVVAPGVRFIYWGNSSSLKYIGDYTAPISVTTYAYHNDDVYIATVSGTYWTLSNPLGYDILDIQPNVTQTNRTMEEVFCDDFSITSSAIVDSQAVARHRIDTNLESCLGLNFYINYY